MCMKDADLFVMSIVHAFQLTTQVDLRGIEAGIRLIVGTIGDLPEYLEHCKASGSNFEELSSFILKFAQPVHLVKRIGINVALNWKEVADRALEIHDHWYYGEYFWFGEGIGELAVIVTADAIESYEEISAAL